MSSSQKLIELRKQLGRIIAGLDTGIANPLKAEPPKEGDRILGTVNDPTARALLSFNAGLATYVEDYSAAHGLEDRMSFRGLSLNEIQAHMAHVVRVASISDAAREFLWQIIHEEIPAAAEPGSKCTVCADYQVVATEAGDEDPDLSRIPSLAVIVEMISRRRPKS